MNEILNDLTKEDLIRVIANITYSRDFNFTDTAWFTKERSEKLNRIGKACVNYCESISDYSLPEV